MKIISFIISSNSVNTKIFIENEKIEYEFIIGLNLRKNTGKNKVYFFIFYDDIKLTTMSN